MGADDIYGGKLAKVLEDLASPAAVSDTAIKFKATYQDPALNKITRTFERYSWLGAVCEAFSQKKSEEKLLMIELEVE